VEAIGVAVAGVAFAVSYSSYEIWKWTQQTPIERCQADVGALLRRLHKGEVDDE
ncbi:hypothetical protein C8A00DRAFT_19440, partial [Chaetomidium leptoderma]